MDIHEILGALKQESSTFPREAVEAAIEAREQITPELLRILENTIAEAEKIVADNLEGTYSAHIYAMFLLAQFREARAYPLIVQLARTEKDVVDTLLDTVITEDLRRILASVCGGDTGLIEELIEDPDVEEYVRGAALRSLLVLVGAGAKSREEVMGYLKSLLEGKLERSCSHVWGSLVDCAAHLHPGEVIDHIHAAFEEGLVDPWFISPKDVERALDKDMTSVLEELPEAEGGYIDNVVDEMANWACFKQPKDWLPEARTQAVVKPSELRKPIGVPPPRRVTKIKPNESCPCGSGKKYKKCCGRIT